MNNVLDLAKRLIEVKKVANTHGGEFAGPCPGCGGRDRFRLWPKEREGEGSYWCRRCGRSGDAIQFLRDFEGLTFHQACERLKKKPHYSNHFVRQVQTIGKTWVPKQEIAPEGLENSALWRAKALKLAHWAYDRLFENKTVFASLADRGIRRETISRFLLGWNPGERNTDIYRPRESWGLSRIMNEKGGWRRLWLPMGMVIPYEMGGMVKRLRIRRPKPVAWGPNYYVVPGSSSVTMVVGSKRKAFVVVESELDAILVAQEGDTLSVGAIALGSALAKPSEHAARILSECLHILVALDFDEAGASAWKWWLRYFPDSIRWPVPMGKDPGEAYQAGVDIQAWVRAGLPRGMR